MKKSSADEATDQPLTFAELGLGPRSLMVFLVVLLGVSGWLYYWFWGHDAHSQAPQASQLGDVKEIRAFSETVCGPPTPNGRPVAFEMLYSEEKQAWVEDAANLFARTCPNIQVKLTAMGAMQSADALLAGEIKPLVWAPTDDLIVDYLQARWKEKSEEPLLDAADRTPLVVTPLVVLIWYDRLRMLQRLLRAEGDAEGFWMSSLCPVIARDPDLSKVLLSDQLPPKWVDWYDANATRLPRPAEGELPIPTREEVETWGRVKLGHTPPTRTASGFEMLYLLAYDYSLPPAKRTAAPNAASNAASPRDEVRVQSSAHLGEAFARNLTRDQDAFRRWVQRCQAGLGPSPTSTRMLTERLIDLGSSDYDGVVTFEHLVFPVLRRIDGYPGSRLDVRVVYPQPTLLNQHPAYLLWPGDKSAEGAAQRRAARRWLAFLLGQEMQQRAILRGFRPASDLSLLDYDAEGNPFLRMQRYGVTPRLELREPPRLSGEVLPRLEDLWKEAAGGR